MLNEAKARAAKAGDKPYKLTDSHRLYLLVKPNGSKLWKWNYAYNGKQKTMNFGIYPMVGLIDARAKRDDARAQLEEGPDPAIVKKLRRQANLEAGRTTFELVARQWHEMTAFSTIKNEWAERDGKEHDRQVIDLMLAHVPKGKVEGAYNRAAYMPRRRELAKAWADMLTKDLPLPLALLERPSKQTSEHPRRRLPEPVPEDFRFLDRPNTA